MAKMIFVMLLTMAVVKVQEIDYYLSLAEKSQEHLGRPQEREKWQNCWDLGTNFLDEKVPGVLKLPKQDDKNLDVGTGVEFESGQAKQTPFNLTNYEIKKPNKTTESDTLGQEIISSSKSLESYFDIRADIGGEGWGYRVAADLAYNSDVNYHQNQVLQITYRDIIFGFEGMITGHFPPLTDHAKDVLCRSPQDFRKIYGTHFIKGAVKGASIEMKTQIDTKDSRSAQKVSGEIKGNGKFSGINGNGSASFKTYLDQNKLVTDYTTFVKIKGGDRGTDIVKSLNMSEATNLILAFANKTNDGTTLSYELLSFQSHPEYTRTLACCQTKPDQLEHITNRVSKILLTELIGLQMLSRWIDANDFGLNVDERRHEIKRVYHLQDQIYSLMDVTDKLHFKDIEVFYGTADQMQVSFLQKYEPLAPKFPLYNENTYFKGKWQCQASLMKKHTCSHFNSVTITITQKHKKFLIDGNELKEVTPYRMELKGKNMMHLIHDVYKPQMYVYHKSFVQECIKIEGDVKPYFF